MGQKITRAIRYVYREGVIGYLCNRRNIIHPVPKVYNNMNELLYDYSDYVDQFISSDKKVYLNITMYYTHKWFKHNFNILLDKLVLKYGLVNSEQYRIHFKKLNDLLLIRLQLLYKDKKLIICRRMIKDTDIMRVLNN